MIQNVLEHIGGVGAYGAISVVLFFAVFTAMVVWAFTLRKPYLEEMGRLPLNSDDTSDPLNVSNADSCHD